jgi:hypothetical protein
MTNAIVIIPDPAITGARISRSWAASLSMILSPPHRMAVTCRPDNG